MKVLENIKQLISLSLIFLLVAPFWISYSSIHLQKYQIKKEIKKNIIAGIDDSELVLLKFTSGEVNKKLVWEHSKEFEYNDIMYDIIKTEVKNDSVYYWCWKDSEETMLNNRLKSLVSKAVEGNKESKDRLQRLTFFFSSLTHTNYNPFSFWGIQIVSTLYDQKYIFYPLVINEIKTPPPRYNPA